MRRYSGDNYVLLMVSGFIVSIGLVICVAVLIGWFEEETTRTPYGCIWLDLDSGKTSNNQLACVKGYFPSETNT